VHLAGDPSWQFLSKNLLLFLYSLFIIFAKSIWATGRKDPNYERLRETERFQTVPYMTKNANYSAQLKLRSTKEKIFHLRDLKTRPSLRITSQWQK
ncbi:MAG: hypothetical protein WB290_04635, partial [Smithella sp.]